MWTVQCVRRSWSRSKQTCLLLQSLRNLSRKPPESIKASELLKKATVHDGDILNEDQTAFTKSAYPVPVTRTQKDPSALDPDQYPTEINDHDKSVLLFPGQGSQFVGMAGKLLETPTVKDMFDRASSILDYDLLKICLEGPKSTLDQTLYSQPAIVVTSLAAVEKLFASNPSAIEDCVATAGFSVGEITALIFSGALTFDDGIRFVRARAEAMQHCSDMVESGMMSIFFGADANVGQALVVAKKWAKEKHGLENPVCQIANYLYAGGKTIAGHKEALQFVEDNGKDFGIRRAKWLPVSGAFHTSLMKPAVPVLKATLKSTVIHRPRIPVYSNINLQVYKEAKDVKRLLPFQVVNPVKWEQSMNLMLPYKDPNHVPEIFECGPGSALCAMLKKINGKGGRRAQFIPV